MGMTFWYSPGESAPLQHLNLAFVLLLYGDNPGRWKSRYPYSRLVFILASDGASGLAAAGKRIPAETGDWLWLPPFLEVEHDQNPSMLHLSVHFSLKLGGGIELPRQERRIIHGHDDALPPRIDELRRRTDAISLAAGMRELCWRTIEACFTDPARRPSVPSEAELARYSGLLAYLSGHLTADIGVEKMAELAGMGRESFAKNFRRDLGCSPKRYFHQLRAGRAGQLLAGSGLSVKEVAGKLGFCNEFYFSRFFKKHVGISPSLFQRLH